MISLIHETFDLQLILDMQRLIQIERLRPTVHDSWRKLWAPHIIKQAFVEKTKSRKLAAIFENFVDEDTGFYA